MNIPKTADREGSGRVRFGGSVVRDVELEPGARVAGGAYEILGVLGRGGMATVYSARRQADGQEVAFKVLNARSAGRADVEHRLHNERVLAAQVGPHPNIVAAFDGGRLDEQGGAPFVVTERVHGPELSFVIATERRLEPMRAARIALDIADGLAALHAHGIAHRDVKPDNILVVRDAAGAGVVVRRDAGGGVGPTEHARLIDFGIATHIAGPNDDAQRGTLVGARPGTPMYMSPEQSMGAPATAAFDVYGLGVTLYEMLTGVTPFAGVADAELLEFKVHRHAAMGLLEARSDLPVVLAPLVKGCLAPLASDRLGLAALRTGLRAVLGLRRADPERAVEVTELSPRAGAIDVEVAERGAALAARGDVVRGDVVRGDVGIEAAGEPDVEATQCYDRAALLEAAAALQAANVAATPANVAETPAPGGPTRAELLLQIHAPDPGERAHDSVEDRGSRGVMVREPVSGRRIAAGLAVVAASALGLWLWMGRDAAPDPSQDAGGVAAARVVRTSEAGDDAKQAVVPVPPPAAAPEPGGTTGNDAMAEIGFEVGPGFWEEHPNGIEVELAPETPGGPPLRVLLLPPLVEGDPPRVQRIAIEAGGDPSPVSVAEPVKPTPRKPVVPKPVAPVKPEVPAKPEVPKPTPAKPTPAAPAIDPSATPECEATRAKAQAELKAHDWSGVVEATRDASCWSSALERARMRVRAFANLGRLQECVDVGAKSSDEMVRRQAEACRKQIEMKTEQP